MIKLINATDYPRIARLHELAPEQRAIQCPECGGPGYIAQQKQQKGTMQ